MADGFDRQIDIQEWPIETIRCTPLDLIPARKQHITKADQEQLKQDAMPADRKPAKRRQKDLDASWTKKHGKSHHGYKLSIHVDKRYKVIRKMETDTASTHDSQHLDGVLDPANISREVYADKGDPSAKREARLSAAGYHNHIQRKGHRDRPLSEGQQRRHPDFRESVTGVEIKRHASVAVDGRVCDFPYEQEVLRVGRRTIEQHGSLTWNRTGNAQPQVTGLMRRRRPAACLRRPGFRNPGQRET